MLAGQSSQFSGQTGATHRSTKGRKNFCQPMTIIALLVLLLSVAVLILITVIQIKHKHVIPPGLKFSIVLDAGSFKTIFFLYQWPSEKEIETGVVRQVHMCTVRESGIAGYRNNPKQATKGFTGCMKQMKSRIPEELHNSTSIYLGATAGMRLLKMQDEDKANAVLSTVENFFKAQPFDFRGAQILTGEEEGVYGWITVNYLMGNFLKRNLWNVWAHSPGEKTTGALDLGGASTQITFVSGEKVELNTSSTVQVSLYGYTYKLYTHSYLCYGRNESEKELLALLFKNASTTTTITNPCYPQKYTTNMTTEEIFSSLCTAKMKPDNYKQDEVVTFEGTGNPALCRDVVAQLFDFKSCKDKEYCSFNGVFQPKLTGPFLAFAGFYFTVNILGLPQTFSLDTYNSTTWAFCLHEWNELLKLLPRLNEFHARSYCFTAHFIYHLLVNGYGFNEEKWHQLKFHRDVRNITVDWALGYMLTLTNQIPVTSSLIQLPLHPLTFWSILIFFTVVVVMCLVFLLYICVSSWNQQQSEHTLDNAVDSSEPPETAPSTGPSTASRGKGLSKTSKVTTASTSKQN